MVCVNMKIFDIMEGETLNRELDTDKLKKAIAILQDRKALEAKIIEVSEHCSYADYFILVSATSKTHAQSISDELQTLAQQKKHTQPEGYDTGQWILNDLGDIIVHIFLKEVRGFYQLDKLWSHAPSTDVELDQQDFELDQYDLVSTL